MQLSARMQKKQWVIQPSAAKADELAKYMSELASLMKDWRHVIVADGMTRFPIGVGKYSINPRNYPPIQRVAETLSLWHQLRNDLINKWNAIPDEHKVGLQLPPQD